MKLPRRAGKYSGAKNKGSGDTSPTLPDTSPNTSREVSAEYFPPSPPEGGREGGKYPPPGQLGSRKRLQNTSPSQKGSIAQGTLPSSPQGSIEADLAAQLAAVTAERDQLRAKVAELAPTWRRLHVFEFELQVISEANHSGEHPMIRAKRAKRQREVTLVALIRHLGRLEGARLLQREGRLLVCLTRLSAGRLDDDNLTGAFKHVRDEIASWLGCNDNPGSPVRWHTDQEPHRRYRNCPKVRLEILGPESEAGGQMVLR